MTNHEMKVAIGNELQTLFHPIFNVTKQVAEESAKELTPMKKTLTDIDGVLLAQCAAGTQTTASKLPLDWSSVSSRRYKGTLGEIAFISSRVIRGEHYSQERIGS